MKNDKTAKTYIEKLGFKDDDLYEKNHDELMEFLVTNKYYFVKYIGTRTGLHLSDVETIELNLEYCVTSKNSSNRYNLRTNYVNGFVDAILRYRTSHCENATHIIEIKTKIKSFGAVLRELNYYKEQLNSYKYSDINWFVLFSNDDKYRKLFEEQGIIFITEKDINDLKLGNTNGQSMDN